MALLTFPTSPANGEKYPASPLPGQMQYQWSAADTTWGLLGSATGVTPGTYGDEYNVASFTVDAQGRLTFAGNVAIALTGGTLTSITAGTGLTGGTITTSGTISLDSTYMASTYLTLAGGTMTGDIVFSSTQVIDCGSSY